MAPLLLMAKEEEEEEEEKDEEEEEEKGEEEEEEKGEEEEEEKGEEAVRVGSVWRGRDTCAQVEAGVGYVERGAGSSKLQLAHPGITPAGSVPCADEVMATLTQDRKSTRLNSSH